MAAQNFKVKNGLTVGTHDIIDSSGNLTVPGNITVTGTLSQSGVGSYATQSYVTSAISGKADTSSLSAVATSGSYNDLTNKPTIPTTTSALTNDAGFITSSALSTYATQSYVSSAISNVIDSAPAALDTLNELAAALGDDANYATTITNALATKANISSLATVATSGSYNDLLNKPTITSGTVTSITAGTGLSGGTITSSGTVAIDTGVVATLTGTQTLTNKTIAAGFNTITGLTNSNLSGSAGITNANLANSSVTVNGTSISLGASATITAVNPNSLTIGTGLSGTSYNGSSAVTIAIDSTVATLSGTQTLTNKTINLTNNTLTGTVSQFNAAVSDDDFATVTQLNAKQATLVSGTNIKTINGTSVLGSGDITVSGGATDIAETVKTISSNYTITSTKNGMSVGPVTVASGVTVTVSSGSRWVVI